MSPSAGVGLSAGGAGYPTSVSKSSASELRIPAEPAYVVVAKRAAAGFGYVAGLGIEAVDDLVIAVAQACENAIGCVDATGAPAGGQIRLTFKLEGPRLEVQVRSSCIRSDEPPSRTAAEREAVVERRRLAAEAARSQHAVATELASRDLALRVMGLFVDDCRYRVDERTGGLRVRLTKYRIS